MTGPHLIPVAELREGDHVDLENDPVVDAPADREPGEPSPFEFEYVVVEAIEVAPDGSVAVEFDTLLAVFPADHMIRVDRDVLPL